MKGKKPQITFGSFDRADLQFIGEHKGLKTGREMDQEQALERSRLKMAERVTWLLFGLVELTLFVALTALGHSEFAFSQAGTALTFSGGYFLGRSKPTRRNKQN